MLRIIDREIFNMIDYEGFECFPLSFISGIFCLQFHSNGISIYIYEITHKNTTLYQGSSTKITNWRQRIRA